MSRALRLLPVALLAVLLAGLVWRLAHPEDTTVRSKLVGTMLPDVMLAPMVPEGAAIPLRQARTKPVAINFFASWCVPCIAEAPLLDELKQRGVPIIGIAVRDRPYDVAEFLARHGNPYTIVGADPQSQVQIALGSAGVPETFIADARGIIRYQHVGPIAPGDVRRIVAEMERAR